MVPGSSPGGPTNSEKTTDFEVSGFFHMTVRKLWVGQKRVKVVPQKNNSFSSDLSIQDGRGNILAIQIRNFGLDVDRSFDCVTLSARYDHGFGFSQLFRFVDDKESKLIETICDSANFEVVPKLLPSSVSKKWRVIVTPVIKSNELRYQDFYKQLMLDVLAQAQLIFTTKLLFSQYGMMMTIKEHQFEGVISALNELKLSSFGSLEKICFEVDSKYLSSVYRQFENGLA